MNRLCNQIFLLCCIVSMTVLHAMDDAHKVVALENERKELLKDVAQLLKRGHELCQELQQLDARHEQYMDTLLQRQMVLCDQLTSDASKKLTEEESRTHVKGWVETIENMGAIKLCLKLKMIKDPKVQSDVSVALNHLQHTVNELVKHDRLMVINSKQQELALKLRAIGNGTEKQ